MSPPKLGLAHPAVPCSALGLCTLTKASLRSVACAMFKGLETNSPRTGIVCLIKQSRRAWCCTWEESGPVWRLCEPVPHLCRRAWLGAHTCHSHDQRQLNGEQCFAHGGYSLGITSALYSVYGRRSVVNLKMLLSWAGKWLVQEELRGPD